MGMPRRKSGLAKLLTAGRELTRSHARCGDGLRARAQVLELCRSVKQTIAVKRARFSALVAGEIRNAINATVPPNRREADAVEARSILDLRSGAAFTRFQTNLLAVRTLHRFNATRPQHH